MIDLGSWTWIESVSQRMSLIRKDPCHNILSGNIGKYMYKKVVRKILQALSLPSNRFQVYNYVFKNSPVPPAVERGPCCTSIGQTDHIIPGHGQELLQQKTDGRVGTSLKIRLRARLFLGQTGSLFDRAKLRGWTEFRYHT